MADPITDPNLLTQAQLIANDVLVWVGFGTIVGLLAKAIMPGRDPGGAVATLAMGVMGTVIGCATLTWLWTGHRITPISPIGFVVSTAGAFCLLALYRLLAGYWIVEGEGPRRRTATLRPHTRRRARSTVVYEDD